MVFRCTKKAHVNRDSFQEMGDFVCGTIRITLVLIPYIFNGCAFASSDSTSSHERGPGEGLREPCVIYVPKVG